MNGFRNSLNLCLSRPWTTPANCGRNLLASMRKVPPEIMATMPKDGASQHDHYTYGWPKERGMTAVFADKFY
jgi:hypothetical protein